MDSSTNNRAGAYGLVDTGWREQEEMIKPQSPCLDCIERQFGCHSGCREYREYAEQNEKYKAKMKEARNSEYVGYKKRRFWNNDF